MIKELIFGGDEPECKHEKINDGWPKEDDSVWYLLDETVEKEYWCERDAVYVKLRSVDKEWICMGCGEEKTIGTAEHIGGEENIKRKDEMDEEELEQFREDVHCGSYLNGWPDHRDIDL